jgi:CRP/FNR family transcriptional regulator, cyclic AMP receptor protein
MRLGGNQKEDLIRQVPLFSHCSKNDVKAIAQIADEIDLDEGTEMTREGAAGREFFVLLEGSAEVERGGEKVNALGAGDFFGEIALISEEPRTATVRASSPVRALVITARSFRRLIDEQPEIKTSVMQAMADRLAPETL